MPDTPYIVAVLVIVFTITLALRAVPFTVLERLRRSTAVRTMAAWLPVGILAILAAATFVTTASTDNRLLEAVIAVAVTVAVHLTCGRRTLLSVGVGTGVFVTLVALL